MNASEQITKRINELADWRGKLLARLRKLMLEADPDIVEEWKWDTQEIQEIREKNMRKVKVIQYVTLDGVMEDPGGAEKFEHGGWTTPYWNDEIANFQFDELFASAALLLGRVTYQGFAAAWPSRTDEGEFGDRMNRLPKFVVSKTLEKVEWNNSRLIKGNVTQQIFQLKQQPGQCILIYGSGELVHTLMPHDLVDEYRLLVYPVVLGVGKRLFRDGSDPKILRLVETKPFSSGVVLLSYVADRK